MVADRQTKFVTEIAGWLSWFDTHPHTPRPTTTPDHGRSESRLEKATRGHRWLAGHEGEMSGMETTPESR
jgi:hypothetical protein